jgi:two-component system, OmpR family, sensor kinase
LTLRTRLLLALLSLVAVGLLAAGAVTYSSLRSFLLQRVDQQLADARTPMAWALTSTSIPGLPASSDASRLGQLPPGTYGQIRDTTGVVIVARTFSYGQSPSPSPALPNPLPGSNSASGQPVVFTVKSSGSGSAGFRVLVQAVPQAGRILIVAIPLTEIAQTLSRLFGIEVLVSVLVLAALAAAAWWLIKRDLRPLESMAATAGEIAAGDLSQRVEPAGTKTEVGRLGLALNAMLAQIEEAFAERTRSEEKLRRFVADASHELRTPLTSIRGYAEVFSKAKANPEDASSSMRRIE